MTEHAFHELVLNGVNEDAPVAGEVDRELHCGLSKVKTNSQSNASEDSQRIKILHRSECNERNFDELP
jgi:hypothetical protein